MDLQDNFLRHKRNDVPLNSFLVGRLLTHEVRCNSIDVSEKDITSLIFWHIKEHLVKCMVPEYINN